MRGLFLLLMLTTLPLQVPWKPQYADVPPEIRQWYETRTLTPAAEARLHYHSCCAHSDVVKTTFKVNSVNGQDEWWWLDANNTWQRVPDDVIHYDEHAPGGDPVMFAVGQTPTCFYPPNGGI